jgi:hypothetical protein
MGLSLSCQQGCSIKGQDISGRSRPVPVDQPSRHPRRCPPLRRRIPVRLYRENARDPVFGSHRVHTAVQLLPAGSSPDRRWGFSLLRGGMWVGTMGRGPRRGAGVGASIGQLFRFILTSVSMDEVGSASGVLEAVQQLSTPLGVAVLGSIFFSAFDHHLPPDALQITAWACLAPQIGRGGARSPANSAYRSSLPPWRRSTAASRRAAPGASARSAPARTTYGHSRSFRPAPPSRRSSASCRSSPPIRRRPRSESARSGRSTWIEAPPHGGT